jgi:hypothetical protein
MLMSRYNRALTEIPGKFEAGDPPDRSPVNNEAKAL